MTISFAYAVSKFDTGGHQRSYRMMEMVALKGVKPTADASGGRLGFAASGEEPLMLPPINKPGVILFVHHVFKVHPADPSVCLAINTVLFEGKAYECVSQIDGRQYKGISITATTLDMKALAAQVAPKQISRPAMTPQASFTPSQLSGGVNGDPNYNNQGGGSGDYNNSSGDYNNSSGDYNNVGGGDPFGGFGNPADNYNNGGSTGSRNMKRVMNKQIGDFKRRMGHVFGS